MNQPLAYVHPGAKIAKNVVVEPFSTINNNVEIGEGTWVGSNVTIMEGARIGKNCFIYPGSVISGNPQDLKFEGEDSLCEIGDNTTIRECVTINRGTKDRGTTKVGSNCLIMSYSHIAHDCFVGDNCIFSNNSTLAGHITVGDYVILSGFVAVHQLRFSRRWSTSKTYLLELKASLLSSAIYFYLFSINAFLIQQKD